MGTQHRAEFWAAAANSAEIPEARGPEIALAGRSNVGKSSLLNRLCRRRSLARTSRTPGCTRGLVFFSIGDGLTLVDLPGYGYARRSKTERESWKRLVEGYLSRRGALAGVLILIDVRRGAQDEERMLAEFLDDKGLPWAWALTKCDKLGRSRLSQRLGVLRKELGETPMMATSAASGDGIDEMWEWIQARVPAAGVKG